MGLDMTLSRKHYVQNWEHNEDKYAVSVKLNGKPLPTMGKVTYVEEEAIYWRKANAIHRWFVDKLSDGVDDCLPIQVSIEGLTDLRDKCYEVLNWGHDEEKASEILPTSSGFFFGGTEYDEYYFEQIKETADNLDRLLKEHDKLKRYNNGHSVEYWYRASW